MTNASQNTPVTRSRWVYGLNVALIAIAAIAIVVGLDWLTAKYSRQMDLSIGQLNTLSPRTQKLLESVQKKDEKFDLINNMSDTPENSDRYRAVADLLSNYARSSRNVTVVQARTEDEMADRIKSRYADELKPYKTAADDFTRIAKETDAFLKEEAAAYGAMSQQKELDRDSARQLVGLQAFFGTRLPETLAEYRRQVQKATDSTSPQWSRITTAIKDVLFGDSLEAILPRLQDVRAADPKSFTKPVRDYMKDHGKAYDEIIGKLEAYKKRLDALPPLKVEDVLRDARRDGVIVLGPKSVRVVGSYDMFKPNRNAQDDPKAPKYSFEGEQAVASAMLAMSNPDKTKVVYVTATPAQLSMGDYSELTDRLQQANFEVLEWSPAPPPMPGQPPMPKTDPPASGKGVVWIVFPPDSPNPQMMMMGMPPPDPTSVVEATQKHMAAGGSVMFLADGAGMGGAFGGPSGYAYAGLLKPWGIDVKAKYTVVRNYQRGDRGRVFPQLTISTFPKHPITSPIESYETAFGPYETRTGVAGFPTVVDVTRDDKGNKQQPGNIKELEIIAQTEKSDNIWADSQFSGPTNTKFDSKEDLPSPLPLAVAASKANGQRVVVIGTRGIGANAFLQAMDVGEREGQLVQFYRYPGNAEFCVNAVNWLADYENMIAVSAQANPAQRVADMGDAEPWIRISTFLLPPILAMAFGFSVFIYRRR